jgi:hypothetical protein
MATLHGILAELGIEEPVMHTEREISHKSDCIVDETFSPIDGRSFEVTYGKVPFRGEHKHVLKKIRIDGSRSDDWFDLEEQKALDSELHGHAVKAFRPIG